MSAIPKIGADFSEVRPKTDQGRINVAGSGTQGTINLGTALDTLENGPIAIVSPFDAFRPGQQILFWLTVYNGIRDQDPATPYISRVRLKPWWLRPNNEFRAPGMNPGTNDVSALIPGWKTVDQQTFSGGTYVNNRACWFPAVKMLDVSEFQVANPPPAAPARQSDSLFVDDLWTLDLQVPSSVGAQSTLLTGQNAVGRGVSFLYVSHGYALGLTHEITVVGQGVAPKLTLDLTWVTGTL